MRDCIPLGLEVLARQPEISFVASFAQVAGETGEWLDCLPLDATLELRLFQDLPLLSRAIMRTVPNTPLYGLFDPMDGQYGEIAYLLSLTANTGPGITVPEPLLRRRTGAVESRNVEPLAYILEKTFSNGAGQSQRSLAQCALWSRETVRREAQALNDRIRQGSALAHRLETALSLANGETENARQRIAVLEGETGALRLGIEEGRMRETNLREKLKTAREEQARTASALEASRKEHDTARERIAQLAGRLQAVENSLTWKYGSKLAFSPPGRLLKGLLRSLGL